MADAELSRLRAIDKERERANNKKLKGFLMRDKGTKVEAVESASIVEVNDDGSPIASTSSA
jgi:FK506-binding protein 8